MRKGLNIIQYNVFDLCFWGVLIFGTSAYALQIPAYLELTVTPNELSGSVSISQGNYVVDEPLSLEIVTNSPEWHVQMHATSLAGDDDEIGPENIHVVLEQGVFCLEKPKIVLQGNTNGKITTKIVVELRTKQRHLPGSYTGELIIVAGCGYGPPLKIVKIPFKVELTCVVSGSISGNKMYFHYGLPGDDLSATAQGEIRADTDVCLCLSVNKGRVDALPMVKSFAGNQQCPKIPVIPLIWALRENDSGWREPDKVSYKGEEIYWELESNSKNIFYELRCSPQPDAAQAPGDYAMSIVFTVLPVL